MEFFDPSIIHTNEDDNIESNFVLIKTYNLSDMTKEFSDDFAKILNQFHIDFPRQNIFIDNFKKSSANSVISFINNNPYLKENRALVLVFMTQTMLSLPVLSLTNIITKWKDGLVICSAGERTNIHLSAYDIIVRKQLCTIDMLSDDPSAGKSICFSVEMELDLVDEKIQIYIQSS